MRKELRINRRGLFAFTAALVLAFILAVVPGVRPGHAQVPAVAGSCVQGVPTCLYRSDHRAPAEIFEDGFQVNGDGMNKNLLDHVSGRSNGDDTAFVSATSDLEFALDWQPNAWVYGIAPTDAFHNVNNTFTQAVAASPDASVRREAQRLLDLYEYQREWSSLGDIAPHQIAWAAPIIVTDGLAAIDIPRKQYNPNFTPEPTVPSLDPFPLEHLAAPGCIAPARIARSLGGASIFAMKSKCGTTLKSDEELVGEHQATWRESGYESKLSLSREELQSGEHLYAPLPETAKFLAEARNQIGGIGESTEFQQTLKEALGRDFSALDKLTANSELIARVAKSTGRALSAVGELLPYAGIVGTGYALKQDLESEDWVNLGFDAIAEVLQIAEAAQPELVPFVEPLILVDVAVQVIASTFQNIFVESPAVRDWKLDVQRQETIHQRDWNAAPQKLNEVHGAAVVAALQPILQGAVDNTLIPRLTANIRQDVLMLQKFETAAIHDVFRLSMVSVKSGTEPGAVRADRDAAVRAIREQFAQQKQTRTAARITQGYDAIDVVANGVIREFNASASAVNFNNNFEADIAVPYIAKLSNNLWLDFVNETRPPRVFNPNQMKFLAAKYAKERDIKLEEYRRDQAVGGVQQLPSDDLKRRLAESISGSEMQLTKENDTCAWGDDGYSTANMTLGTLRSGVTPAGSLT